MTSMPNQSRRLCGFMKIAFVSDTLVSITLLVLIVINIFFYQLNALEFIKLWLV